MSAQLEKKARHEASLVAFLQRQLLTTQPKPIDRSSLRFGERGAIVTGANGGLGFEAARQLCELGIGHLIITARTTAKGEAAVAKLRAAFPEASVESEILNMDSYESITSFAERCRGRASQRRIDMALLNAGIQMGVYETNPRTGHEVDLQVNYLSTALLSILLLPILKSGRIPGGPAPVLSVVASDLAHRVVFEDPRGPVLARWDDAASFTRIGTYGKSKCLVVMFCEMLATRVKADVVSVNASNPGLTKGTVLGQNNATVAERIAAKVAISLLARSTAAGASVLVDALVVGGPARHGSYLSDWTEKP